jgi:hypothetical protein
MKQLFSMSFAALAFTLVSCQQASQPGTSAPAIPMASSNAALHETIPFEITLTNTCCGEDVAITGNEHVVQQSNGNGHFHLSVSVSNLVGTGSTGDTYHGGLTASEQIDQNDGSMNFVEHFTMTSSSGCKFKLTANQHVTYDANGIPHAERSVFTTECF